MQEKFININTYDKARCIVYPYIFRKGGSLNDAEDVLQEGFIKFFEKLSSPDFQLTSQPEKYVYGVCVKIWSDKLKKRNISIDDWVDIENSKAADDGIEDIEKRKDNFRRILNKYRIKLSEKCQQVFKFREEGLSCEHIAGRMGWDSSKIAKNKFHLCKRRLLELASEDPEFKSL